MTMVMLVTPLATARAKTEVRMVTTDERLSLARFVLVFLRPVFDSLEKNRCVIQHTGDFFVSILYPSDVVTCEPQHNFRLQETPTTFVIFRLCVAVSRTETAFLKHVFSNE